MKRKIQTFCIEYRRADSPHIWRRMPGGNGIASEEKALGIVADMTGRINAARRRIGQFNKRTRGQRIGFTGRMIIAARVRAEN